MELGLGSTPAFAMACEQRGGRASTATRADISRKSSSSSGATCFRIRSAYAFSPSKNLRIRRAVTLPSHSVDVRRTPLRPRRLAGRRIWLFVWLVLALDTDSQRLCVLPFLPTALSRFSRWGNGRDTAYRFTSLLSSSRIHSYGSAPLPTRAVGGSARPHQRPRWFPTCRRLPRR